MPEAPATEALARFVEERLQARADEIVVHWIDWVRTRLKDPAVEALPERALRNHIPPVLQTVARYVTNPSFAIRDDMLGHLRLHGQIRRDQGYDIEDVMAELDGLAHMVTRTMGQEILRNRSDDDAQALLTVFGRLATALRTLAFVAVSAFRRTERDRRQEVARRLSKFGHTIAHEMRSPIQAVIFGLEVLQDDSLSAAARHDQIEMMRNAMKRAAGMLEDVRLLAMTEAAYAEPVMAALPGVLEDLHEEFAVQARSRGITLEFDPAPPRVAVETVVAQLALANVIGNAIKYSDAEKPERWVKVRAKIVDSDDTPFVCFEVEDNGIGIDSDYRTRVFQRHFRAHPDVAEGTGLGLAITQELVTERGGKVELESERGVGTLVRLTLRAIDTDTVESPSAAHAPDELMHRSIRTLLDTTPPDLD